MAAKLFTRLDQAFGRSLLPSVLFAAPTIRALAERHRTSRALERSHVLVALRSSGRLPPVYAVPGVFGNVVGYADLCRELGREQPCNVRVWTDSTRMHYGEVKRNSTTYRARTRGDMVTGENARELGKLLALRLRAALSQESGNT